MLNSALTFHEMKIIMNNDYTDKCKKELELYVHIPFCIKKCAYCDFLSAPADEKSRFVYMEALKNEIRVKALGMRSNADITGKANITGTTDKKELSDYIVTSVFVGGGTPTVLDGESLADLLKVIKEYFDVAGDAEITFECNPGTADFEKLKLCRDAGYNRISIGLQSTMNDELKTLGRIHSYEAFEQVYSYAVKSGFENINVDLMSAIPGQTIDSLNKGIDRILELKPRPKHISAYSLILEEGTAFWKMNEAGELMLPDEDTEREMHWMIIDRLEKEGYQEYELSNLAIPGYECRHNIGYWIRKPYIGLGLGAASLFEGRRLTNTRNISEYIEYYGSAIADTDNMPLSEDILLNREDEIEEFMFLGLRMTRGVSKAEFRGRFDTDIEEIYGDVIAANVKNGLLECSDGFICLSRKGQDLANYVFSQFILG